jgi:hypothetical protein
MANPQVLAVYTYVGLRDLRPTLYHLYGSIYSILPKPLIKLGYITFCPTPLHNPCLTPSNLAESRRNPGCTTSVPPPSNPYSYYVASSGPRRSAAPLLLRSKRGGLSTN